jgi:hypothetical protein
MIIKQPLNQVKDQLIVFIDEGFGLLGHCFENRQDQGVVQAHDHWRNRVVNYCRETFPTTKEVGQLLFTPGVGVSYSEMNPQVQNTVISLDKQIKILESILNKLTDYYQFEPDRIRLYVQNIDSFSKVKGINHQQVQAHLDNGFLKVPEEQVKKAFAQIIGQSYIPKDWGGETEDIYSSLILLNGQRVQTSIIFKGQGTVKTAETQLGNLGKNGDQLDRMFRSPSSKLFIIQSVKPFAQNVINTAEAHAVHKRANGQNCYYCVIDGQDTAMLLFAYGLL